MMFSRILGDNLDKNHEIYAFVKLLDTEDDLMLKKAEKYMKIKECLKRAEEFSLDSKINLTDDDGKFMKRNGKISQSYNIQASSSEGYIVAIDIAESNAENDLKQLVPILSQVERNVGKRIEKASAETIFGILKQTKNFREQKIRYRLQCSKLFFCVEAQAPYFINYIDKMSQFEIVYSYKTIHRATSYYVIVLKASTAPLYCFFNQPTINS